jgi:hypothetical protein
MLALLLPWFGSHSQQDATWTRRRTTANPAITVH